MQMCTNFIMSHSVPKLDILRLGGQLFLHVVYIIGIYCQLLPSKFYSQNSLY